MVLGYKRWCEGEKGFIEGFSHQWLDLLGGEAKKKIVAHDYELQ